MPLRASDFVYICAQIYGLWLYSLPGITLILFVCWLARCWLLILRRSASSHTAPSRPLRGRQESTTRTPDALPFGFQLPDPPQNHLVEHVSSFTIIEGLANTLASLIRLAIYAPLLFVIEISRAFFEFSIRAYVTPIQARIQQRIAQAAAPSTLNASDHPRQYIFPGLLLLGLIPILTYTADMPLVVAGWICVTAYPVIVVAGMSITDEAQDSVPTPETANLDTAAVGQNQT